MGSPENETEIMSQPASEESKSPLTVDQYMEAYNRFRAMNRPGEIDAQTGEITIYEDDIDTARKVIGEVINSAIAKGKESLAVSAAPLAKTKLAKA